MATHEIRFGDNDRLAALVAHLVHADALILLSDVDALYTGHPRWPGTARITDVRGDDDLAGVDVSTAAAPAVGTGGMVTKIEAARIATSRRDPGRADRADQVAGALGGRAGRHLLPSHRQAPADPAAVARHASDARGALLLDAGAVRAVVTRNASLLPAGHHGGRRPVRGRRAGRPGRPATGRWSPAGWSTTTPTSCRRCWARPPARSPPERGSGYDRTVVHRDALVVMVPLLPRSDHATRG